MHFYNTALQYTIAFHFSNSITYRRKLITANANLSCCTCWWLFIQGGSRLSCSISCCNSELISLKIQHKNGPWKTEEDFYPGIKFDTNIFKINILLWAMQYLLTGKFMLFCAKQISCLTCSQKKNGIFPRRDQMNQVSQIQNLGRIVPRKNQPL